MTEKISNLKKVHVSLLLTDDQRNILKVGRKPFAFIFGCASTGLNPLELELTDKMEGDELMLSMHSSELPAKLGHLLQPIRHTLSLQILPQQINLLITVDKVEKASEREIIQAMAGAIGSGCGSNCDCGCC